MTFTNDTIKYAKDADGIVTLTLDDPQQSANTMNERFRADWIEAVARLEAEKDGLAGVILTSAKKTFFAGGDLNDLIRATPDDVESVAEMSGSLKAALRTFETLGLPTVAVIQGAALGGGYELALACHHRIALDARGVQVGLPEVSLGLLPGGGGVVRTVRLLGIQNALMNVLLQGQRHKPSKALELGLVDELVDDLDAGLAAAIAWVKANPESAQPWDQPGYAIPGGGANDKEFMATAPAMPALLKSQLKGAHHDAPHHILCAAVEGTQVPFDRAIEIETRYFVDLVCNSQQAKNMTQAFFFDLQSITKGGSRPDGFDTWKASKVAVLGAGMMGAGIAYQCARSGIDVVLKDVSVENAEKGKDYSRKLVDKAVSRGKLPEETGKALLDRITTTGDYADLEGCDLVIEAVFESVELKHQVFADTEEVVAPDALLGSNTSTLPITELAQGVKRQEDFIGLHFFSPVDKMPLVEIITGEQTSDAALARAVDLVLQINKTPIVVNDSRGFFTSRVIGTFLNEAVAALGEGINPVLIERAGLAAGYPAPPLQLMDELTLTLPAKIEKAHREAMEAAGIEYTSPPATLVGQKLIELGREGRASGAGFYEYDQDGKRAGLWSGLRDLFDIDNTNALAQGDEQLLVDLQERMLFAEALEAVKCFDEGVLTSYADANIGSIFGIGFPAWTGGVAQYIDQYPGGVTGFVARAKELADRYGEQFLPPASLLVKAESGEPFRPDHTRF